MRTNNIRASSVNYFSELTLLHFLLMVHHKPNKSNEATVLSFQFSNTLFISELLEDMLQYLHTLLLFTTFIRSEAVLRYNRSGANLAKS